MEKYLFRGAITELIAPANEDCEVDFGALDQEIDRQLEGGIRGLFVNGLATECLVTTREEQLAMAAETVKRVRGRIPVMGNIAATRPCDARALLEGYEACGVDAVSVTQPAIYGYTADALYRFYADLAGHSRLPVYIYNAPQTGNTLSPALVARLVGDYENIRGYKDSVQDIIHLQSVMAGIPQGRHFECLAGSDATIYPTLALGGCGVISLISALFPKPVAEVCELYFAGRTEESREAARRVLEIRTALKGAPFLAGYKYVAGLIGMPLGRVRPPLSEASGEQKRKIKESLEKLGLL